MPRSRRRHHSRSRSRSRSHSHDRDREAKRRKIDALDSPPHKRSVSSESSDEDLHENIDSGEETSETNANLDINDDNMIEDNSVRQNIKEKLEITPKKVISPKQVQKKLESEKKREQQKKEREEREKKKNEEKERKIKEKQEKLEAKQRELEQKQKEKEFKEEQKRKEREEKEEQKRREREEKEQKRKEREEKEEQKRKEREEKDQKRKEKELKRQQELDEKNKEKQRKEEKKQKAAAVFVNFFVPKKSETDDKKSDDKTGTHNLSIFMPFEVKTDMRLPPVRRKNLNDAEKENLVKYLNEPDANASYLADLKRGKSVGRCGKTWPFEDEDVIIVEENIGESICEDKSTIQKIRAKFFKFDENQRPPYFGTWQQKSKRVKPRRPFARDVDLFDYEVDSDDDWEKEEPGESLNGSDDEDKENDLAENDDYEVDNDFFVPHGHLSDDEVDDEANAKLSPESLKQKLKLLKAEFDHDMQLKTLKIKPRSIGCIWYEADGKNVDEAIDRYLQPYAMIVDGSEIIIKNRTDILDSSTRKDTEEVNLDSELAVAFLKFVHGNAQNNKKIVNNFISKMNDDGKVVDVSKAKLTKFLKKSAQWIKCLDSGPMLNKFCWYVDESARKQYDLNLSI